MKPSPKIPETLPPGSKPTQRPAVPKAPNFDTMKAVKRLKGAGFEDKHAVTLVETLQDAQVTLATRDDLARTELALRSDMEKMESGIRHDMEKMESGIRHDMEKMESGIRHDMEKMELRLRDEMKRMELSIRSDMEGKFADQRRLMLVFGSITTGILGMLILLTK